MMRAKSFFLYLSLFLSLLFFLFSFFRPINVDFDLGRHLLFGKIMIESGDIIRSNTTSYTYPDFEYILSHWLPEVVFYLTQSYFGFQGITILLTSVSLVSIGSILLFARKRVIPGSIALTFPLFAYFMVVRSEPRPEIFSYLFTAFFIVILYKFREKYTNWVFLLVLLEILWVNMHIYFAIGPVLITAFLIDSIFSRKQKVNSHSKTLFIVLLLTSLAAFINPFFVKGALNPLLFFGNYGVTIEENLNVYYLLKAFNWIGYIPHLFLMTSTYILLFVYRKKMYLVDWILVTIFTIGSLFAIRNYFVYLYVILYIYLRLASYFLIDLNLALSRFVNEKQLVVLKTFAYASICTILSVLIIILISMNGVGFGVKERAANGMDFYQANDLQGPIWNSFDLGQYISYRLYPGERVYVDGRPEAYPSSFFDEIYNPSLEDYQIFLEEDNKYGFNTYIIYLNFYKTPKLIPNLLNSDNHKLVYLDSFMMILVKNNVQNKEIIEKHEITEDTFIIPEEVNVEVLSKYVILFDQIGWKKKELELYDKMLSEGITTCFIKRSLRVRASEFRKLNNIKELPEEKCKI